MRLAGLDGWDGREAERYEVMESEELELQIRWRRHEDCKFIVSLVVGGWGRPPSTDRGRLPFGKSIVEMS